MARRSPAVDRAVAVLNHLAAALRRVPEGRQRELADHLLGDDTVDVAGLLGLLDRVPEAADLPVVVALRDAQQGG